MMAGPSRHHRRFDNWKSTRIVVRPRVVGDEVGVALGFFVVELRQELRRAVALRPPRARKQRTSKYVRWSGVFIYRTVENVRRRSHRHRNSAIRPHGNGDFMLRRGAFLRPMRRNGDPLFQFSLFLFMPLLVVVIRVSSFSLSSTLFPSLRPLSLSVRRITGGRGKTSRTGGGTRSRLSPGTSRGKKRIVHHPPRLSHGRHARSRTSFRLTRFFATTPRTRLAPWRDADILRSTLSVPFSSEYHAWELSKRAQRAVRVVNYRGRINWNSFRYGASNLNRERKFRHPSFSSPPSYLSDGMSDLRSASLDSRRFENALILQNFGSYLAV